MDKFLNKEVIFMTVCVIFALVQMNYFATKLDVSSLKLEMLEMQAEMKTYTDNGDKELLKTIESKFNSISYKLDRLKG